MYTGKLFLRILSSLDPKFYGISFAVCRVPSVVDAWRLIGTGVRQVNHSEALGGQQDSMAFIKIRLVRLFTALAVKRLILTRGVKGAPNLLQL